MRSSSMTVGQNGLRSRRLAAAEPEPPPGLLEPPKPLLPPPPPLPPPTPLLELLEPLSLPRLPSSWTRRTTSSLSRTRSRHVRRASSEVVGGQTRGGTCIWECISTWAMRLFSTSDTFTAETPSEPSVARKSPSKPDASRLCPTLCTARPLPQPFFARLREEDMVEDGCVRKRTQVWIGKGGCQDRTGGCLGESACSV